MHKLIRWYNQNTIKAWFGLIVIILFFLIFFRLRNLATNREFNVTQDIISLENNSDYNSISLASDKSVTTGQRAEISNDEIEAIDKFISFCNSGNIQEAYNLISNECKEQLYNEVNDFQEAYYKPVFAGGKRIASIEIWSNKTYIIELNEDALATGSFSKENSLQDYFTIVHDDEGNIKLNINGYIGRVNYNKTVTKDKLEIKLLREDKYMDYDIFTFNVRNNLGELALLGKIDDSENVSYLVDKNNIKYQAYVHEMERTLLELDGNTEKTIQIKYFNEYSSSRKINRLVFPRVYLNYNAYLNYQNKNNYAGLVEINFDF